MISVIDIWISVLIIQLVVATQVGVCRLLWSLLRAGMAVLTHFFCKRYFLYVSRGHKTFLTGFWGFLPSQKGPKFLASVLNELFSRNWGAPLNFRKLLSTSTDKLQANSPQRDGFQKLRGAPQFPETALQCTITDIASTTSKNDFFRCHSSYMIFSCEMVSWFISGGCYCKSVAQKTTSQIIAPLVMASQVIKFFWQSHAHYHSKWLQVDTEIRGANWETRPKDTFAAGESWL